MDEKNERARLLRRVGQELGRELTTSNLFLHTLIAGKVGLNATDTRCLEILARSGAVPMTAGALKDATGLTTGAITGIVDRLERAGFVKRMRDSHDRRKVFVKLVPTAGVKLTKLYESIGAEMEKLASRYTINDLQLIEGFLDANLKILKQEITTLSSSGRGRDRRR
jgi:DNA-binding MarR family transcriptional regulator